MPMSWFNSAMISAASVIGAACLAAPAPAEAGIVVASSGPSAREFPVGKKLPETVTLVLKSGDSVTILDKHGAKVLHGPDTISLNEAADLRRESTFAAFTRLRSASRVRTGAVRAGGMQDEIHSPNLWYVDVTNVGTTCIPDPGTVRLWRPDISSPQSYSVRTRSGSFVPVANFGRGAMIAPWDAANAPVRDGSNFIIRRDGTSSEDRIAFAVLPEMPDNPEDLAEVLIARGCVVQLDLLASTLGSSTG